MSARTIHKYPLPTTDFPRVTMPGYPRILKVECQRGEPFIWALVRPDATPIEHRFRIFGTGHPVAENDIVGLAHVATFQQGSCVWHVFGNPNLVGSSDVFSY